MFFTTLAVQLAKRSEALQQYICDAIEKNGDIATQSLADQWRQLILSPLSKLRRDSNLSSYILVIDALDECDNSKDIQLILQLFTEARSLKTVQLRVLLTSRPDIPIRHSFHQISEAEYQDFVLHNISPSIVDHDIFVFLEHNLRLIGQNWSMDTGWPGEEIVWALVKYASGLFIWAATACRFIQDGKQFATKRLATILENSHSTITVPEKHLDEMYTTVLNNSISLDYSDEERKELFSLLRDVLGSIVILLSPLSIRSLSKLISKQNVEQTLEDLHAIISIPKDRGHPLRLHHPSFRDFLLDESRCSDADLWVDEKQIHQQLAYSCIELMSTFLTEDICDVHLYGILITEVELSQIERCLPQEVQYACLYWIKHLQNGSIQLQDNDKVHRFLQSHLLFWLEALSWMQKISEGILEIISLESTAAVSRLVVYNRTLI